MGVTTTRYQERPGRHPTVAAVWSYGAGEAGSSLIAADGCFDLIVRMRSYGPASASVCSPVTSAHVARVEANTALVGLRIQPGYGAALTDHGSTILRAVDDHLLKNESDPDRLESLVATAIDASKPPNIVAEFVSQARATSGRLRLTTQSSSKGERELQRACRRWLGLSPKVFLRIERAWAARSFIQEGTPLAELAATLGYSDQSHLARDIRELFGVTPRRLRPVGILQDSPKPNR